MSEKTWNILGLTDKEYALITEQMGREPNLVELNMYSVMWSEHCSYKHSRLTLKEFPTTGKRVLVGPGENAGVVDIGDGWAAVFKIESHNHPSAVEPYQGAATGVGGILRDIFTMGARPVAFLNSLRFGELNDGRVAYLFDEVVAGIGGYGNCVGIPTVAGEIYFDPCYKGNPLVNAMCVGVMPHERLVLGKASGPGNLVIIAGARTGMDGIHGVTFASEELSEESEGKRPAVQVGDPFMGKLLMEAILEIIEKRLACGVQDLGGAGLTCALSETASRAGTGMDINLDKVPLREEMGATEILTSESQERMLLIVEPQQYSDIEKILNSYRLPFSIIGKVTGDGKVVARLKGEIVAAVPAESLAGGAPAYEPHYSEPPYIKQLASVDMSSELLDADPEKAFKDMILAVDLASREWVWRRYDYMVRTSTVQEPGGDAAVIRLRETGKALAVTVDGNGLYTYLNPYAGGMAAVAEATRNLSCTGAEPIGITDCLNFGNPEKPHIFWQFREAVAGMSEACRVLGVPVIGGNVSFYNEVEGEAIYPTPVVGAVGLLDNPQKQCKIAFSAANDQVYLLGSESVSLGGSQYLKTVKKLVAGKIVPVDLEFERNLQEVLRDLIASGLVNSAHDLAEGGLSVAVAECAMAGNIGVSIELPGKEPANLELFGEGPSRIIVSVSTDKCQAVTQKVEANNIPLIKIGTTGGDKIIFRAENRSLINLNVAMLAKEYREVFPCVMNR